MSLDDRRYVEEIKNERVPEAQQQLNKAAGKEIALRVDWETFDSRESVEMLEYTLKEIPKAVAEIASDDMGKEALSTKVTAMTVINSDSDDWKKNATLDEGTFRIEWNFGGGSYVNASMIQQRLNDLL